MGEGKWIEGTVIPGHQVASSACRNPLFPGGTLAMQAPYFEELGLDLSDYHLATLNTSIAPSDIEIVAPDWRFEQVKWHPEEPEEDFSFVKIWIRCPETDSEEIPGLIYHPHPETKPAHFQPKGTIEIILKRFVDGLGYGSKIEIGLPEDRVKVA